MELSGEATISNLGDSKIQTYYPNRLCKQTAQEDLTATQTDSPNRVPTESAQTDRSIRIFQKIYQ